MLQMTLGPFRVSMEISLDTSFWSELAASIPPSLQNRLQTRYADDIKVKQTVCLAQARRMAQATGNEAVSIDGIGELCARIPAEAYYYWVARKGPGIWNDQQFLREFIRDNPSVRVKSRSRKIQVGYSRA